jgi:hypothetical protein
MKMIPSAAAMPRKITMGRYWSRNAVIELSGGVLGERSRGPF